MLKSNPQGRGLARQLLRTVTLSAAIVAASAAAAYADYSLVNPQGGDEPAYSYAHGEYTVGRVACGITFYISYRSENRVNNHFSQTGQLVRKSDRQVLCRWGNW